MDHKLVAIYLGNLEQTLEDANRFPELYRNIVADKRIGQPEAVELASRFLDPIAKSTSRPKALRRLLYRHEKMMEIASGFGIHRGATLAASGEKWPARYQQSGDLLCRSGYPLVGCTSPADALHVAVRSLAGSA